MAFVASFRTLFEVITEGIRNKPLSFGVLVTSGMSHLWIALSTLLNMHGGRPAFIREFLTCLCISAVLEIAEFYIPKLGVFRTLHILRCCALLILFQLLSQKTTYIPVLLSVPLLIETALYDDTRFAVWMDVAFIILVSAGYARHLRGGEFKEIIHFMITYLFVAGLTTAVGSLMVFYREILVDKMQKIKLLNKTVLNLSDANKAFQIYANSIESESTQKERNRITRELHDMVGYAMTNVIIMMNAARVLLHENPSGLDSLLEKVGAQSEQALNETRQTLYRLRNVDSYKPKGLLAISQLTKGFEGATGIEIQLNTGNLPWSLGQQIDTALFRFVQEGLTNAFRHGKANSIWINLWQTQDEIRVCIRDNGRGLDSHKPPEDGIGLSGMKERFNAFGGEILAHNVADGFEFRGTIPYRVGEVVEKN